jgi:hypothetical protein
MALLRVYSFRGTYESRAGECALKKDPLSAPRKMGAVLPLKRGRELQTN